MVEKYKKVINNPKLILIKFMQSGFFYFLPDNIYLKIMYKLKMNKKLNLNNPHSFNEKLQWLKLYDRKPEYIK